MGGGKQGFGGQLTDWAYGSGMSDAAQGAATAQQYEAKRQYREQRKIVDDATVSGLAALDKDIANQEKNLSRQEQLISQLDPTIIEASQQALKLLRGEQSQTLAPLQAQRAKQRETLLNTLRQQLGPGAETSAAGQKALQNFDLETSSLMGGAQQSALSNLAGISSQFTSQRPDMLREISGLSAFGQGKTSLSFDQAKMLNALGAPIIGTAGAQFTGDLVQAQKRNQRLDAWNDSNLSIGESWATMGMGSMGGGGDKGPRGGGGPSGETSSSKPGPNKLMAY